MAIVFFLALGSGKFSVPPPGLHKVRDCCAAEWFGWCIQMRAPYLARIELGGAVATEAALRPRGETLSEPVARRALCAEAAGVQCVIESIAFLLHTGTTPQCPSLYSRAELKPAGVVLILGSQ